MATKDTPSHPLFAAVYDPLTKPVEATLLQEHREHLVAGLMGTVLDLGAGTGAMFDYFKSAASDGALLDLYATEPDPHMRRRAITKAEDIDLEIEIEARRAESLPYKSKFFDSVIASLVFCTIPDIESALSEIARVLKPTGELRFLEHVQGDGILGTTQNVVNPVWRHAAAGCNLTRNTEAIFRAHPDLAVTQIDELDVGIPPIKPFIRGTVQSQWNQNPPEVRE